jgi:hypothetical protein
VFKIVSIEDCLVCVKENVEGGKLQNLKWKMLLLRVIRPFVAEQAMDRSLPLESVLRRRV